MLVAGSGASARPGKEQGGPGHARSVPPLDRGSASIDGRRRTRHARGLSVGGGGDHGLDGVGHLADGQVVGGGHPFQGQQQVRGGHAQQQRRTPAAAPGPGRTGPRSAGRAARGRGWRSAACARTRTRSADVGRQAPRSRRPGPSRRTVVAADRRRRRPGPPRSARRTPCEIQLTQARGPHGAVLAAIASIVASVSSSPVGDGIDDLRGVRRAPRPGRRAAGRSAWPRPVRPRRSPRGRPAGPRRRGRAGTGRPGATAVHGATVSAGHQRVICPGRGPTTGVALAYGERTA